MVKIAALATLGKNCVPNKVWNFVQCLPGSRCLHSTFQQSVHRRCSVSHAHSHSHKQERIEVRVFSPRTGEND